MVFGSFKGKFKGNFRILDTVSQIKKKVLSAVEKIVRRKVTSNSGSIEGGIKDLIIRTLKNSETYRALISDELRGDFGFEYGTEVNRVNTVIEAIASSVRIEFEKRSGFTGLSKKTINVKLVTDDLTNLYNLPESVIVTDKGEVLNWLEWLLERGSEVIIQGYDAVLLTGKGRSRIALMVKTGGFWKVPVKYQGTLEDNWITRELSSKQFNDELAKLIEAGINK